jgi:hypothetical protein
MIVIGVRVTTGRIMGTATMTHRLFLPLLPRQEDGASHHGKVKPPSSRRTAIFHFIKPVELG